MIAKIREGGHLEEGERGHCLVARRRGLSSSEEVAKESTLTYNAPYGRSFRGSEMAESLMLNGAKIIRSIINLVSISDSAEILYQVRTQ